MNSYLEWLDEQIALYEREVARYTIAKEVFLESKVQTDTSERKPKPKHKHKRYTPAPIVREKILAAMQELGRPAKSREIFEALGGGDKWLQKAVWNSLYQMQVKQVIEKDFGGTYKLTNDNGVSAHDQA